MQPHANIPTKYLPHALPFIHLGGLPEASDKLGTLFPESGPPGAPGSCASHVGTTSLLFRDILPRWVLRARQTAKPGHFRSDMTFRQAMEHSGDSSKTASFLTLWDDVIEVPPNPKLYVYQRPIPGCRCGTKGLRVFARRVARGALTRFIGLSVFCSRSQAKDHGLRTVQCTAYPT